MSNVQHSSGTDEWYTPTPLVDRFKKVLGPIDLDPASSPLANSSIGASVIWTKEEDSLSFEWGDRVEEPVSIFLNPPSKGKLPKNRSWSGVYWAKLMDFRATGLLKHAIFLGFSLESN